MRSSAYQLPAFWWLKYDARWFPDGFTPLAVIVAITEGEIFRTPRLSARRKRRSSGQRKLRFGSKGRTEIWEAAVEEKVILPWKSG